MKLSAYRVRDALWLKRAFLPDGLPLQLTFFVTSQCNAKCSHCFYGEQLNQPLARELTVPEIDRIASGLPARMLWVAFGGGEPFLRQDLADVAGVFFKRNRPRLLTVVTNGINPNRIEATTREIIARRGDSFVNVAVSLDALEETHDRERGVPGNFQQAIETLRRLRALRKSHDGFGFSTLTTVHRRNAHELAALERFIDEEIRPDNRGLNLVRGTPFDPTTLDVDLQPYRDAAERKRQGVADGAIPLQSFSLTELNGAKERVLYAEVERIARTGEYKSPCRAGRIGAVMYENGDVAACEILGQSIGNVRDYGLDFSRLWFSESAHATRQMIDQQHCRCTWECAVNTNVLFGPRYWPALLREWITGGARTPPLAAHRAAVPASVSVVIPCRDEAAVVSRKIRNSLGLRFPDRTRAEVLVVDDGSNDRMLTIVNEEIARHRATGDPLTLRVVANAHESGKAGAIRTGFEEAQFEIVMLTDADVVIEREGLARALVHFADPRTGVVCGEQVYCKSLSDNPAAPGDACTVQGGALMDPPGRDEGLYDRVMRGIRKFESRIDSTFAVHGQMMLFRRSLALSPRTGVSADDVDLSLQARRKGFRIKYATGARFWEGRPESLAVATRQKTRRGMSLAQVLWRNRDMLGRPRYGAFGVVGLPFQWAFLMAQPIGVALALTFGLGGALALSPLWGGIAVGILALLTATSRGVRNYLHMNAMMLFAIGSLVAGRSLTDRWPRDRDAGETA